MKKNGYIMVIFSQSTGRGGSAGWDKIQSLANFFKASHTVISLLILLILKRPEREETIFIFVRVVRLRKDMCC